MIKLGKPQYFFGDNLGPITITALLFGGTTKVVFTSVWMCIFKITLCSLELIPLLMLFGLRKINDLDNLASLSYWIDMFEIVMVIYAILLPFIWIFAIYNCVILPRRRIIGPMNDFISKYIPDATVVKMQAPTNFVVRVNGYEFEVVYTNRYKVVVDEDGEVKKRRGSHVIVTYFDYYEGTVFDYFYNDDNMYMRDEVCEEFDRLCRSDFPKLDNNDYSMWAVFDEKLLKADNGAIEKAMGKMVKVMKDLNLKPLTFEEFLKSA